MSIHSFEDLATLDETVKAEAQAAVQRTVEWPGASAVIYSTLDKVVTHLPTMNSLWKLHTAKPPEMPKLWFGSVPVSAGVIEMGAELAFSPDKRNGIVQCKWLPFASQSDTREATLMREWLVPSEITQEEILEVTHEFLKTALEGSLRLPIRW